MCDKCNSTGWIKVYDSVPYGSTNVQMESSEMCDCLEKNECPVCGETLAESAYQTMFGGKVLVITCANCGYRTEF